jgi:hypothetical protein
MAWGKFEQNYVYNYDINACLDAVMRTGAQRKLKVKAADRNAYKVVFSTGMSLTTWGEKVHVALGVLPDGKTGIILQAFQILAQKLLRSQETRKMFVNL